MATTLFLRDSTDNGIAGYRDMIITAGTAATTGVVTTTASGTEIQWTKTAGGAAMAWISGRVPAGGFTLAGVMSFSIWAHESATNANSGARIRIFKYFEGSEVEIGGGPWNDGIEFTKNTPTEMTWTGDPTDTAFAENDRIVVKLYITNVGVMGGGQTCTLTYDAASAATGDAFLSINETITFKTEAAGITVVGTVQSAATSVPAYSITYGVGFLSNVLSIVSSVPGYSVPEGVVVLVTPQTALFSLPSSSILYGVSIIPSTLDGVFSLPLAEIKYGVVFAVGCPELLGNIPTYTVVVSNDILIEAAAQILNAVHPSASIVINAVIYPSEQTVLFSVPTSLITGAALIKAASNTVLVTIPSATVVIDIIINALVQTLLTVLPAGTVITGSVVEKSVVLNVVLSHPIVYIEGEAVAAQKTGFSIQIGLGV